MLDMNIARRVDYEKSFKQYVHSYEKLKMTESKDLFIRGLMGNLLRSKITRTAPCQSLVFINSMDRQDYNIFFDLVKSTAPEHSSFSIYAKNCGEFNFEFSKFFAEQIKTTNHIKHTNRNITLIYKALFLYSCFAIKKLLEESPPQKVVFFSDMQCFENFTCQYLKLIGVKTATLQHGLYVEYHNENNINIINYKHHVSDYFLAWGKQTESLIKKYIPNSNVVITGKPSLSIKPYKKIAPTKILLVLDQNLFGSQNSEMIKILKNYCDKHKTTWAVRFHPGNDKKYYTKKHPYIVEENNEFQFNFVIGHTSSLLYEALAAGYKIAKFASDAESIETPKKYHFYSLENLEKIITNQSSESFSLFSNYLIESHGEKSLDCYKKFLNNPSW